ncbi:hypothetical protein O1611_g4834 [Lasiodiplodia mahajangana]|uniref:Uncharacterized protein n=1 Tax=Lasiodiplodia mahajangana TaxID=1108764 RepID=A0ACC2JNI5_9PEZI|nr:hypothetical protein O1611_g4834 [Lasiodiplodia mahajangana]
METPDNFGRPMAGRLAQMWLRNVDDWSGVTNKQERKRIQNRRNQRTYRARRRAACTNELDRSSLDVSVRTNPLTPKALVYRQPRPELFLHGINDAETAEAVIQAVSSVNILTPDSELNRRIMKRFEELAVRSYAARSPQLNILPSLSQFNFLKALFTNVDVLGLSAADMHDDALSPFNVVIGPVHASSQRERLSQLPLGLRPTNLQRETLHHPWIDLIPIPAMRDNIFRPGLDAFDEEQLCHDIYTSLETCFAIFGKISALETCFGRLFWETVLGDCFGRLFWETVLGDYFRTLEIRAA